MFVFRVFWSVFSRIRTESGEILRISPYSVRMRENTDHKNSDYRHFTQWIWWINYKKYWPVSCPCSYLFRCFSLYWHKQKHYMSDLICTHKIFLLWKRIQWCIKTSAKHLQWRVFAKIFYQKSFAIGIWQVFKYASTQRTIYSRYFAMLLICLVYLNMPALFW